MDARTTTGIPGIADVPWGTHYCHFYDSKDDLADTLVPYFKAGLDTRDACLWVTAAPLRATDARAALAAIVPDLAHREAIGQIEIVDHEDWYLRTGKPDAQSTLRGWIDREQLALSRGYSGLRLTGNTYWLERSDWSSFVEYERLVNETFHDHRILGLCSYCFERCTGRDVLDVVSNHQFAVVRRDNVFQVVESAQVELARQDLMRVQRAVEELRDIDRRKDQFIAMLGHELRNPLAPIVTAVDLMRLRGTTDRDARELEIITRQLRQLTTLVDDMLDLSRISRGQLQVRLQPTELREVLARASEAVMPLMQARQHRFDVADAGDVRIEADANRLVQVFTNLLVNAAKYTPTGGRVALHVDREPAHVVVTVTDNGPGVAPELLPRVFEPFVQGERALDRREGGLGLGLPIVKSLVELHGGDVSIRSSPAGTTVVTRLPRPGQQVAASPVTTTNGKRLLLVDDNEDAAVLLAQYLEQLGYEVRIANDADAALAITGSWLPHVSILDIGLPGIDGYELARRLRAQSGLEDLRLIALTGYGSAADVQRARGAGFAHHLTKPVSMTTLARVLGDIASALN